MQNFHNFIQWFNNKIWGLPLLMLLMGTHLFFTFRFKFIQKNIGKAIKLSVTPDNSGEGDVSPFASLTTTLAATLGTGNIIGISTAVSLGGPGAIFWCWLTGILGMATTYAECYLGITYRQKTSDGTYLGGPMYALEHGVKSKALAIIYCFFTLLASFGVGCSTQSKAITETTNSLFGLNETMVGMVVAIIIGFVIIGGVKKISTISSKLVPAMSIFYIMGCTVILILNHKFLISSLILIVKSAFLPQAMVGGFIGSTIKIAARQGIAKGLFTNEAGLGSAAIAAAMAKTKDPKRQALISMSATFWDTVVMCAITGLVIVSTILKSPNVTKEYSFADLTTAAFSQLPLGELMLGFSLIAFAFATLIGWCYLGEKAAEYLFGKDATTGYRICYLVMIFIGSIMSLELVWDLTDTFNALMAIPNLIALLYLYKKVKV